MFPVLFTIAVLAAFVAAIVYTALSARAAIAAEYADAVGDIETPTFATASDSEFAEAA